MSNMNDMSNMGSTDNPNCADEANEVKEKSEKDNGGEKSKPNTLGEKIRKLRKAEGWTQEDLAWECDLSTVTIGKIERGAATPKMATVRKLEEALGLLQDSLMTDYQTTDDEGAALDLCNPYERRPYREPAHEDGEDRGAPYGTGQRLGIKKRQNKINSGQRIMTGNGDTDSDIRTDDMKDTAVWGFC